MLDNLVIGMGNIGVATKRFLEHLGYSVEGYDAVKSKGTISKLEEAERYWICTPETAVGGVLNDLRAKKGLVIIRSTTVPGETDGYIKEFGRHMVHNPAFSRERSAYSDMLKAGKFLVGECCEEHGWEVAEIYEKIGAEVIRVKPAESEMIKLATNGFLTTLISYWNEIFGICEKTGLDADKIAKTARKRDGRIPEYGTRWTGKAFGGKCLPKDLNHLIGFAERQGHRAIILESVRKLNQRIK
ncbi:UDP-glucose 6-dehydrogenase TuaD [subsurface metagenome]